MAQNGLSFKGYDCISDCSAHKQGYDWAKENMIEAKSECEGPSTAFLEGCYAWAEEQEKAFDENEEGEGYYTFPDDAVTILE